MYQLSTWAPGKPETTFLIANARDKQPTNDDDARDTVNKQPVIEGTIIEQNNSIICWRTRRRERVISVSCHPISLKHHHSSAMERVSLTAVMILAHSVHCQHNQFTVRILGTTPILGYTSNSRKLGNLPTLDKRYFRGHYM